MRTILLLSIIYPLYSYYSHYSHYPLYPLYPLSPLKTFLFMRISKDFTNNVFVKC